MVHDSFNMVHNFKCLNSTACLNEGWISNQVFGNEIGNQVLSIGVCGNWLFSKWISNWVFGNLIGTQVFTFCYSVIELVIYYSVTESVINYWKIRNYLYSDYLFCNGMDSQLLLTGSVKLCVHEVWKVQSYTPKKGPSSEWDLHKGPTTFPRPCKRQGLCVSMMF